MNKAVKLTWGSAGPEGAKREPWMQYTFGMYQLDLQQYELSRAGERLPLRPKAFQVLVYLLTHRERVVSKAELLEHVWPKEYVSDAALSSCLKTIRRVLDDDGREQRMIRTVRGQGYRFILTCQGGCS
jgi:DNA-binding winged helix-turn-helix (wHTH) protein